MNPIFRTKPLSDLISSVNKTAKLHQSHERVQGYKIIKGLKSELIDISREISLATNIEGFLAYRCIYVVYQQPLP